jgi:hypothetical protein
VDEPHQPSPLKLFQQHALFAMRVFRSAFSLQFHPKGKIDQSETLGQRNNFRAHYSISQNLWRTCQVGLVLIEKVSFALNSATKGRTDLCDIF